jgi:ABC-type uncharacterized transport system permease subunit
MNTLERYENLFLIGAVLSYLAAMIYFWGQLWLRADELSPRAERWHARAGKWGRALISLGVVLHLLSLLGQGSVLLTERAGVAGLIGWTLALALILFGPKLGRDSLGAFITPVTLLAAFYSLTAERLHVATRKELLESQWLPIHVTIIVMAYAALAFAFASALIYLIQETLLKRKKLTGLWQRLPSLQVADDLIFRATLFGSAMFALGLLTGVVGMLQQPDYRPLSDPKVMVSMFSWFPFALYFIARGWLGWRGRSTNLVVVYGFVILVISFLGVPHILTGGAH